MSNFPQGPIIHGVPLSHERRGEGCEEAEVGGGGGGGGVGEEGSGISPRELCISRGRGRHTKYK